jgi:hypothetical protein
MSLFIPAGKPIRPRNGLEEEEVKRVLSMAISANASQEDGRRPQGEEDRIAWLIQMVGKMVRLLLYSLSHARLMHAK